MDAIFSFATSYSSSVCKRQGRSAITACAVVTNRAEIAAIKAGRDKLTAAMVLCHNKDIKTAGEVLTRSDQLKENLKREQEMQAQCMGRMTQKKRERSVARRAPSYWN